MKDRKLVIPMWTAFSAFVVLMAANGEKFLTAMLGVPELIKAYASLLPLGSGSLLISMAFAGSLYHFIRRRTPAKWRDTNKDLITEIFVWLACIGLTLAQITTLSDGMPEASDLLVGMLIGAVGGWSVPVIVKTVEAIFKREDTCSHMSNSEE